MDPTKECLLKLNTQYNNNLVFQAYSPLYDDEALVNDNSTAFINATRAGVAETTRKSDAEDNDDNDDNNNHLDEGSDEPSQMDNRREIARAKRKLEADKV